MLLLGFKDGNVVVPERILHKPAPDSPIRKAESEPLP